MKRIEVGLLTVRQHPLLPYLLDLLAQVEEVEPVLVFDEKGFSAKDEAIFRERTDGAFPTRDVREVLDGYRWMMVADHNSQESVARIRDLGIRLLVNAGTPRRLGPELLGATPYGVLNVHPGILPKYRGASCCEWAIYNDDPVGVTAHFMDEGLDSGPILFSRTLSVRRGQGYAELRAALYRLTHLVSVEAIRQVVAAEPGSVPVQPQGDAPVFRPMPPELLELVKQKLAGGGYPHAQ